MTKLLFRAFALAFCLSVMTAPFPALALDNVENLSNTITGDGGVTGDYEVVGGGSTLNLQNSGGSFTFTIDGSVTGTEGGNFTNAGDSNVVITDGVRIDGDLIVNGGTLTLGGENAAASIDVADGKTLTINGTLGDIDTGVSTYVGNINLNDSGEFTMDVALDATQILEGAITMGAGGALLTKEGDGTLTLAADNNSTITDGKVDILGGTVRLTHESGAGGAEIVTGTLADTGVLELAIDDPASVANVISGTGGVLKTGDGVTTLTGTNTYTGATNIAGGVLVIGDSGKLDAATAIAISEGAIFRFDSTSSQTLSSAVSGAGQVEVTGTGALTLGGDNTYTGNTKIGDAATLQVNGVLGYGDGTSDPHYAGNIEIGLGGTLDINQSSANQILSGVISGAGDLDYTGDASSALTLAGDNTFTGNITIGDNSTVVVTGTLGHDSLTGENVYSGIITIGATSGGKLIFDQSAAQTIDSALAGTGILTKQGSGTLTLTTAANGYDGGANVLGGTLRLENVSALGGTNAVDTGTGDDTGTLELALADTDVFANDVTGEGNLTLDASADTDVVILGGGSSTLDYTGMTTVKRGTLQLGNDLASAHLTLYAGTTFDANGQAHSLADGSLTVLGGGAQYTGDLNATGAALTFSPQGSFSDPMLTVSGDADITDSTVQVNLPGNVSAADGMTISLLEANGSGGITGAPASDSAGMARTGSTVLHDITAQVRGNELLGTLTNGRAVPQAKSLSEGFLGGLALTLQGADLVAGQGMESAMRAGMGGGFGINAFGTVSGGSVRYNTGSYVDMSSVSLLTGLALGADLAPGRLTAGAFFEYGNGSYDTHNSFSNAASVKGDGDTHYTGGGILGRMDFRDAGPGHVYLEASGRMGRVSNDYDSSDLRDAAGLRASYDSSSMYYGLHLGTGYVWNITDKASLDMYGKYFWTRQEGDSVTLSTGESLKFRDADSQRLRLGARAGYAVNEYVSPYAGAAWEYEFDGEARATTNGYAIDAPDLKGSTGIGEIGLTLKPSQTLPLSFDLGVQGYAGKREGVTGSLRIKFEF